MAKNKVKMNKFLTGAVTATMVATAVVPMASANVAAAKEFSDVPATDVHFQNIMQSVERGLFNGYADGTFKPYNDLKRSHVAKVLANYVVSQDGSADYAAYIEKHGLATKAVAFNDVSSSHSDKELFNASLIVKDAKIFEGSNNNLMPTKTINRQQMAKVLVNAFGLVDLPGDLSKVKDNDKAFAEFVPYINILSENGVTETKDGKYNPAGAVKRAQMASFLNRAYDVAKAPASVVSVTATSTTTLALTGKGLNNLKVENLTLAGNTPLEVVASKDGKTATVKFASAFIIDQEYSLAVKVEEVESTFKFKFAYDVTKAEVVAGTFDDDTKGQKVGFKINGADADLNALKVAGYTVKFVAVNSSNVDVTSAIFNGASGVETGALADSLLIGDYTVQVSVSKGSNVVVSEKQTIKVRNLELAATAVKDYVLTNTKATVGEQKSSTLVVSESATVDEITVTANGADFDVTDVSKFKLASSAPAVVSVSGNTLTANTPGTATITVTYGDVKKDFTVTVANAARKVAKFTPASSSVAIVGTTAKTSTVSVSAVDQYGDLVVGAPIKVEVPSIVTSADVVTGPNGKADVVVTSAAAGSGVVVLKSNGVTLGSFGVRVTQHDNVTSKRLELVKKPADVTYSTDASLDLSADKNVEYALNLYNSENLPNGTQDLSAYKVSYNADVVTIGSNATGLQDKVAINATNLTINAKNIGSTTVAVYDATNLLVGQFTVTVTNTGYSINSVSFKSVPTIDYKGKAITVADVLDIVDSTNDDIVKGITLSKPSAHAVRISASGVLYIDANGNGMNDVADEVQLGNVTAEVVTGATNLPVGPIGNIFAGVTTATSGDKGTVVFKVMTSPTQIKASTSVNVDVK